MQKLVLDTMVGEKMIPFNKPPLLGTELQNINLALSSTQLSGGGSFGRRCEEWFRLYLGCPGALLTSSCTHSLEMAALLLDIGQGDEVIMPSYTFVSTANAFVLHGAKIVFVDIDPRTMVVDIDCISEAISSKTKAIVIVHYAGVCPDMQRLTDLCISHNIPLVEDAAQALGSTYKGKLLGTFGSIGTVSFHETKNLTSGGEGGLLILNDESLVERSEIIREKGTNRVQFWRREVNKYSWVDIGSSYLMCELQAAYLWAQLQGIDSISQNRRCSIDLYHISLKPLEDAGFVELPICPDYCEHNFHMFFIKCENYESRERLRKHLNDKNINAVFHYVPLHSSIAGRQYGRFHGEDVYTTRESERLLRLPLWYGLTRAEVLFVVDTIFQFYELEGSMKVTLGGE